MKNQVDNDSSQNLKHNPKKISSEMKTQEDNDSSQNSKNNPNQTTDVKSYKKMLLIGIVTVVIISAVCVLTGCFLSTHKNPQLKLPEPIKINKTNEFRDIWNKTISEIKYKNTPLDIDFDKYKLGQEPQNDLSKYLSFESQKLHSLKSELISSKNTFMISPFITWVEKKDKISYNKSTKKLDSDALMQYVSKIISPNKAFSRNTIDTVVQLNEFCYYFDRNKDKFYRQGYTRNVKNCRKIEKILKENGINYKMY